MSQHALRSPSGAEKWINCPGSIAMEEGLPDTNSDYADEGTAAHFLQAHCLTTGTDPVGFLGREIAIWIDAAKDEGACFYEDLGQVTVRNRFRVDADFCGAVRVSWRKALEYKGANGTMQVEVEVPIDQITGEDNATGTSDVVILTEDSTLIVDDLKFGRGDIVSPVQNKQLLMYASGTLRKLSEEGIFPAKVKLVIHQPRISHEPSEWDCSIEDVEAFEVEARAAAVLSKTASEFAINWKGKEGQDQYLVPTEKGCRWCKAFARHTCPVADKKAQDVIGAGFEVLAADDPVGAVTVPVALLDGPSLTTKMNALDFIENWCKAVRVEVERRLNEDGNSVPGYKLVEGRKGNRKWRDEVEAENLLKAMRIKHDQMYDYKVISPTDADKLHKADVIGKRQWPKLEALIVRGDGKPSVARADDKRPAISVADGFEVIPDDGSDMA